MKHPKPSNQTTASKTITIIAAIATAPNFMHLHKSFAKSEKNQYLQRSI
jgi:hypothetical protein